MPYVVLNKNNIHLGDVIVAATSWTKDTDDGKSYVYLPKGKCDRIKEYLEKQIPPFFDWEQHECDILIRNIPTLGSAYKAIELVRKRGFGKEGFQQYGVPIGEKRIKIAKAADRPSKEISVTVYESLSNDDDEQDMFQHSDTDNVKVDPFGDVVPPLEQPLPILSSALSVKPTLPVTKAKSKESTDWVNTTVHGEEDPLGDVSTPPSKPIGVVQIPHQTHTGSKPTPPAAKPKSTIVHVPDRVYNAGKPKPPATKLISAPPQIPQLPKNVSVVVHKNPADAAKADNFIIGTVVGGNSNKSNVFSSAAHPIEPSEKHDNQFPQLQSLLVELRSMITSNQAEMKRQVCEGFKQMQHSLMLLLEKQTAKPVACRNPECATKNRFTFNADTSFASSTKATDPVKPTTTINVALSDISHNSTLSTGENLSETDAAMDISDMDCKIEPDESMQSTEEGSNISSSDNPGTSSGTGSQRKTPNTFITSMDKMDRFEKQLSDKKIQQQVHKWVDKTFGRDPDVDKRLLQMLNRLIDVRVFQHFRWKMPAVGLRRLVDYPNFIGLFEHASRTVTGDTVVLNKEVVENFFKKHLAYAQQRKHKYQLAKTNEHTFKLTNKEKTWNDPS